MANRDLSPWRRQGGVQPFQSSFARDPFASFRREMDRLFDDFFAPAEGRSFAPAAQGQAQAQGMIMPSLDVHETEQAYVVSAELPGIDPKDVEINLDDNALTLRGEKRSERNEEDGGRRYTERSYGRFERTIPFGAEVDADRVEASFENGVLKVTLPKNTQAKDKSRRIEIKGQGAQGAASQASQAGTSQAGSPPSSSGGSV
jgi:HSP20 family protein